MGTSAQRNDPVRVMYLLGVMIGGSSASLDGRKKTTSPARFSFFRLGHQGKPAWAPPGDQTSCGTDRGDVFNGSFRG